MAEMYEALSELAVSGGELTFFQSFFVKFYQAFIYNDRWMRYIEGVGTTLLVTAMALTLGILLGAMVALVRTAHDQQKTKKNILLGILNFIFRIYVTIIRGTPMMVQLLIMGMVVFSSSRNFTMVGTLTLGINSGAYVSEIIRRPYGGGFRPDGGGPKPRPQLHHDDGAHYHSPGDQGGASRARQ